MHERWSARDAYGPPKYHRRRPLTRNLNQRPCRAGAAPARPAPRVAVLVCR
jgi:hypothetical protein